MMQMPYFYEISKRGLVSRTKGSGWPESRDGLALFTEMPKRVLLRNRASAKSYSRNLASIEKRAGMAVLRFYSISLYHLPSPT